MIKKLSWWIFYNIIMIYVLFIIGVGHKDIKEAYEEII